MAKTLNEFLEESLLNEILDNPYEYKKVSSIIGNKFKFTTEDNREFNVDISSEFDIENIFLYSDSLVKSFNNKIDQLVRFIAHHIRQDMRRIENMNIWQLGFSDNEGEMGLTNRGDAFRILATVGEIAQNFVRNNIAKTEGGLIFMADKAEASRVRLYHTFTKRMEKELPLKKVTREQLNKEFNVFTEYSLEGKTLQDLFAEGLYNYLLRYSKYNEMYTLLTPGVFEFLQQETELNLDMIGVQV